MPSIKNFWLILKDILRSARQTVNSGLEPLGLTSGEGDILFHLLTAKDKLSQEQLARRLDIGKAAVSRAVTSLETKGFVVRIRRYVDGRSYDVSATEKAFTVHEKIESIYNDMFDLARKDIDDTELMQIAALLSRVAANLKTEGNKHNA